VVLSGQARPRVVLSPTLTPCPSTRCTCTCLVKRRDATMVVPHVRENRQARVDGVYHLHLPDIAATRRQALRLGCRRPGLASSSMSCAKTPRPRGRRTRTAPRTPRTLRAQQSNSPYICRHAMAGDRRGRGLRRIGPRSLLGSVGLLSWRHACPSCIWRQK
jgi:mRNA-degrading endonuclease toxin of MazEF toxin-antitoxin module